MKAMVLAAGYGERMKPLTWNCAKPALPLLNRPSILHLLEHLARSGVTEAVINLHYRPETIRTLRGEIEGLGIRVRFLEEPSILGTGGGLKNAESFLRNGTLLMVNSDMVTDCPLLSALDLHRKRRAAATLVLTPYKEGTEYGAVEMDEEGRIRRIAGRPGPETGKPLYHFVGIHILEPRILDAIPPGVKSEINREVYPRLIMAGETITGFVYEGFWRELGNPLRYLEGSLDLLSLGDSGYLQPGRIREGIFSSTSLESLRGSLLPPFLAGREVRMEDGCVAEGAVLGNRVVLESGSTARRSILWEGARLGKQAVLSECIVGFNTRIPPHLRLERKIVLDAASYGGDLKGLERVDGLLLGAF
jgi:NDP-sugar pyrophosphorylase family protein